MLWIAVHLPLLSLESFVATLPAASPEAAAGAGGGQGPRGPAGSQEPRAQPVALMAEHKVVALNAAGHRAGIKLGHKRATALALAPTLVTGEADGRRDGLALQAAAHAALAFTPSVSLREQEHLVLLEVQASLRYFGGLPRLLQRLKQALGPLGHALQCATAPTALGAALLAQWQAELELGRHTTDLKALAARLDAVPVWLLGPGREHWEAPQQLAPGRPKPVAGPPGGLPQSGWGLLFEGMGLHDLGDLRSLPRAGLARRFGPGLLEDLDRAYGLQPDPCDWITLPPEFDSRVELFARADTTEQVLHGAGVLLRRLVAWAQAQHARVGRFVLRMHHEPRHREGRPVAAHSTLEVALAEPSADAEHLQVLLRERLGRAVLEAPTLELSLHCSQAIKGAPPNAELFPTPRSEREGLTRLIERLQARLGREQVLRLQLHSDHRPECSGVLAPADGLVDAGAWRAGGQGGLKAMEPAPAGGAFPAAGEGPAFSRPGWLLPQPEPLPERQFKPVLDGQPLHLLAGPERIETGWWDGADVQRDYFIAQAADGALVWIYRDRLPDVDDPGSGWFLQGRFA